MWKNFVYMCNSSWGDPVRLIGRWKSDWRNLSLFRPQQSTEVETWSCRSWRSWEGSVTARDPGIATPLVCNTSCLQHPLSATPLICSPMSAIPLVCNTPCLPHLLSATLICHQHLVCDTSCVQHPLSATPLVRNTPYLQLLLPATFLCQQHLLTTPCLQHLLSATPLVCNTSCLHTSLSATPLVNNTLSPALKDLPSARVDIYSPFQSLDRSEYSHICFIHCQEFLPCPDCYLPSLFTISFFQT